MSTTKYWDSIENRWVYLDGMTIVEPFEVATGVTVTAGDLVTINASNKLKLAGRLDFFGPEQTLALTAALGVTYADKVEDGKYIVCYTLASPSDFQYVVIASVAADGSITFGTPLQIENYAGTVDIQCAVLSSSLVLLSFTYTTYTRFKLVGISGTTCSDAGGGGLITNTPAFDMVKITASFAVGITRSAAEDAIRALPITVADGVVTVGPATVGATDIVGANNRFAGCLLNSSTVLGICNNTTSSSVLAFVVHLNGETITSMEDSTIIDRSILTRRKPTIVSIGENTAAGICGKNLYIITQEADRATLVNKIPLPPTSSIEEESRVSLLNKDFLLVTVRPGDARFVEVYKYDITDATFSTAIFKKATIPSESVQHSSYSGLDGKTLIVYNDVTTNAMGGIYYEDIPYDAVALEDGLATDTIEVMFQGVSNVHTGLQAGCLYYQNEENLSLNSTQLVGKAVSATKLQVLGRL